MIPVLSREQMRAFDAHAIDRACVPGIVLMENAGRGAVDVLERKVLEGSPRGARAVIVCGTGNNGGDGFVVGRHLLLRGAKVEVFLVGQPAQVRGDARTNLDALLGVGGTIHEVERDLAPLVAAFASADVLVDALFGTGLDRPVRGGYADVIARFNEARGRKLSLDIPSGLDADTGGVLGTAVRADHTVTFAHYKLGLLTPGGASHAGVVHVSDIGVPPSLASAVGIAAWAIERSDVAGWLAPRPVGAHKNTAGHVAVFAGSPGKIGAALMVARASLRAGAGLTTIVSWPEAATAMESRVLEAMTARIDPNALTSSIDRALTGKRAVVIGPGFGVNDTARAAVAHVLARHEGPIVVDADALTVLAGDLTPLAAAKRAILTPHPGELARLLGTTADGIEKDRFSAAREAAHRTRSVVLLKGAHTIVAAPDGRMAVNTTGNPALATAGAGDVLGGILGALACALEPFEAACTAAYLHGLAADEWRARFADRGLLASEIGEMIPTVLAPLAAGHTRWPV